MKKRVLAIMLACLMMVSLLPMGALADGVQIKCPGKGENHDLNNCTSTFVEPVVPTCGTENFGYDIYSCNVCGDLFAANFYKGDKNEKHDWVLTDDKDGYCAYNECTKCGAIDDSKSHDWDKATCTEAATCKICGKTSGKPLGHTFGTTPSKIIVAPNEKTFENGLAEYTCSVCDATEEVVILAHKCADFFTAENWVPAQGATCTKNGNVAHYDCPICDRFYAYNEKGELVEVESVITKLASHTIPMDDFWGDGSWMVPEYTDIDGDGKSYLAPTCTATGYAEYICVVCKEKVKETLDVQHNWTTKQWIDATCATYGYVVYICELCGADKFEITPPLKHSDRPENEGEYYYSAATCENNAYYEWLCTKCYQYVQQEVYGTALGHDLKTVTVAATCGQYGYTYTYCARVLKDYYYPGHECRCVDIGGISSLTTMVPFDVNGNGTIEKGEVVEYKIVLTENLPIVSYKIDVAGGFSKTKHERPTTGGSAVAIEPTCDKAGLIAYWCASCDKDVVETIPATGHTKAAKPVTVPATCQSSGYVAYLCTVCEKPIEVVEVLKYAPKAIYESEAEVMAAHVDKNGNPSVVMTGNWREGDCETVGLYRYECLTCKEVMLVKDAATGHHTAPANLPARSFTTTLSSKDNWGYHSFANPMYGTDATISYEVIAGDLVYGQDYEIMYGSNSEVPADLDQLIVYISCWNPGTEVKVVVTITASQFKGAAPTCTENGYTAQYNCTICGEPVASETYIPAVKDADGKVVTEAVHPELAALGHNKLNHTKAVAPTCTTAGVSEGFICATCGLIQKAEAIPALGHDLTSVGNFAKPYEFSGELFVCGRKDCGEKLIKNFISICDHEWEFDRKASSTSTCTKNGCEVYVCAKCEETMEIELALAPHANKDGKTWFECDDIVKDMDYKCVACNAEKKPDGTCDWTAWTYYKQTCTTEAYMIRYCVHCHEDEVVNIAEPAGHDYKTTEVVDEKTGVVVGYARVCSVCGHKEVGAASNVAFSFTIENAANAKGELTDGSLVKVTVVVTGSADSVWGFKFDIPYSENLTLVKTNYCVDVCDEFVIYGQANSIKDGAQWVTVAGNANGSADVAIDGTMKLVELYFVVELEKGLPATVSVDLDNVQLLNYKGEKIDFVPGAAKADAVALMDVNKDGFIDMADILAAYKMIGDGKYSAAADIDKNGVIEAADLQAMYKYLIGAKTYAATRKTGIAAV